MFKITTNINNILLFLTIENGNEVFPKVMKNYTIQ